MYEIAIFITETRSITMSAFKIHLYGEDSHSVYNVLLLKYEKGILSLLGEVSRIWEGLEIPNLRTFLFLLDRKIW